MGLSCGIVGLPNAGKSTLFSALTSISVPAESYPFCTVEPNVGVVEVPDKRLDSLFEMFRPPRKVPAVVKFVDIAGLVRGASKGEGLGNRFLAHIREVGAIVEVVRCFEDDVVSHVNGRVDPVADVEIVDTELILADLETLGRRIEKVERDAKSGDKKILAELEFLKGAESALNRGLPARSIKPTHEDERQWLEDCHLLTAKPILYVANVGEGEEDGIHARALRDYARRESKECITICAKLEAELAELLPEERGEFLRELRIEESGLTKLIERSYPMLGLINFFTVVGPEVRAWTIPKGTPAVKAAGEIHTDMERGFIRAEVISYEDLMSAGSIQAARERGLVRLEGKEYEVKDGDVIYFRFSV
ncbi:MAG: redox-regulated ATPase YchF [bacterium]